MKKALTLLVLFSVTLLAYVASSCRHHAHIRCEDLNFHITVTTTDALLSNSNGTLRAVASGGKGFQYKLNTGTWQDSGYFAGLAPNQTYTVIGKNSIGCTDTQRVIINSFDPCAGVTITVNATPTNATLGQTNGSIVASATGGTNFTYSLNGGAFQSSGTFSNLAAGNYTVAAKTADGCIGARQVTVGSTDPCAGITVAITTTQVNPTTGNSNGSITASATGGTGFTYSLNGGAFQSGGTFTALASGSYTITAKNSNGCIGSKVVVLGVTDPCAGVTITVSSTQTNPTTGNADGSISVSATGGSGFTYSLNGGAYQSGATFTGLGAGSYTITAKNSNGCIGSTTVTLVATNPCAGITINVSATTTTATPCTTPASGVITATATGSSNFMYNINGGAYQTGNIFSNLNAANYVIGAKDANGCVGSTSVTISATPKGPTFTAVRNLISTRCSGGGCHMNGGSAAGYNFDADCNLVLYWNQINMCSVTYQLTPKMPKSPQALFTTAEKQIITNWVNAGHRYTD
jgi:hypothetical protein